MMLEIQVLAWNRHKNMAGVHLPCCNFLQGEGTREGTGKCNCDHGYEGDLCDECKDGYFEESKNETHSKCTGREKKFR